jgi:glutaredoxin 2
LGGAEHYRFDITGVQQLIQKESNTVSNAATAQILVDKKEATAGSFIPVLREVRDELEQIVKQLRAIA